EAMQRDLHTDLLVYLIGDKKRVVFDETHLGVYESPNTATLAQKYGLQGFLLGLMVLAGLFIWHNSMSLVPPARDAGTEEAGDRSGKDKSAGLVNLLKRNIPPGRVLDVCVEQWKKGLAPGGQQARRAPEMEKELEDWKAGKGGVRHPVEGYLRLVRILNKRR